MPKATPIFTNFTAGEFSPRQGGRVDMADFYNSCRILENLIVVPSGGVERRPGTVYVTTSKTAAKKIRLERFKKSRNNASPFVLEMGESYIRFYKDHAQVQSGGSALEVSTAYVETELFEIQLIQHDDTMYLVHKNHAPYKLRKTGSGDSDWALTTPTFSAGSGEETFGTSDHYPGAITTQNQRLIFAGTGRGRQTVWGSVVGATNLEDFTQGTSDAAAFEFDIVNGETFEILTMAAKDDIHLFTDGPEVKFTGSGAPITPSNFRFPNQSFNGAARIQPKIVHDAILYVQGDNKKVRSHFYLQDNEVHVSPDMTARADHITGQDGITQWEVQQRPDMIIWATRADGQLLGLTNDRLLNVYGWHRHITEGTVESVTVVSTSGEDEIWLSVLRECEESGYDTYRYIEYMKPRNWGSDDDDIFFVDSGVVQDGGAAVNIAAATAADPVVITAAGHGLASDDLIKITDAAGMTELNTTDSGFGIGVYMIKGIAGNNFELHTYDGADGINGSGFEAYTSGGTMQKVYAAVMGLDHLEGLEVAVLTDGAKHPEKTVSSNEVSLDWATNKIHVGLAYTSTLKPQRLEGGSQYGTAQTKIKKVAKLGVRFYKTINAKVGPDTDNLDQLNFRDAGAEMDAAPEVYNGDKVQTFPGGYSREGDILVIQEDPFPMSVLALVPWIKTNE